MKVSKLSRAAAELARGGKGKPKRFSPEERTRRATWAAELGRRRREGLPLAGNPAPAPSLQPIVLLVRAALKSWMEGRTGRRCLTLGEFAALLEEAPAGLR